MKKILILMFFAVFAVLSACFASATLQISKHAVSDVVIAELNRPAVFDFSITNLGDADNFEIYSLVGADISPRGFFLIASGETKNIKVEIFPDSRLKRVPGITTFTYSIRGQNSGIQDEMITIKIIGLQDAINIYAKNINPESSEAVISLENRADFNFAGISMEFESAFFNDAEKNVSLSSLEVKDIAIPIDKNNMKRLAAGQYILNSKVKIDDVVQKFSSVINFVEQSGLSTREKTTGIISRQKAIEKTNEGNIPVVAEIVMKKDIVSRLFTTFNIAPDSSKRSGLIVTYKWNKELKPSEALLVSAKTNYLFPLIIIIAILVGIALLRLYATPELAMTKRVNYVKTKGGEFALRITLAVKARRFMQKISIVDRLPPVVKLFEGHKGEPLMKYDERTRRVEWNIESLNEGEERIFSYIVYSRMGFVGKFELPAATALYEREGEIKEASSNKAFFMNEPTRRDD